MKQTEVVKIDSRGRIVIPRTMRRSLGLKEDAKIMMIYEDEKSEIDSSIKETEEKIRTQE